MIRLLQGDCRETLATLPEQSVHAVITSPPYWGLRDYGTPPLVWGDWTGSLGLEPTPELFVEHLVECFRAVWRVLRDDGTLWLNLGDSYAGSGKGYGGGSLSEKSGHVDKTGGSSSERHNGVNSGLVAADYKAKDLMEIPSMVAQALRQDGWYLRSRVPWLKRNSMPESVTDRPSTAVEYVFLLSKSARYYWDAEAVRVDGQPWSTKRPDGWDSGGGAHGAIHRNGREKGVNTGDTRNGRSRRNSDWFFESWQGLLLDEHDDPLALIVNPAPFRESHFATFPPKLVEPMVKASTSERGVCAQCGAPWRRVVDTQYVKSPVHGAGSQMRGRLESTEVNGWAGMPRVARRDTTTGWQPSCAHADAEVVPATVLDCFSGAGTVGMVADRLGRHAVLCELKPDYGDMSHNRVTQDAPLFHGVPIKSPTQPIDNKQGELGKRTYTGFNERWDAQERLL